MADQIGQITNYQNHSSRRLHLPAAIAMGMPVETFQHRRRPHSRHHPYNIHASDSLRRNLQHRLRTCNSANPTIRNSTAHYFGRDHAYMPEDATQHSSNYADYFSHDYQSQLVSSHSQLSARERSNATAMSSSDHTRPQHEEHVPFFSNDMLSSDFRNSSYDRELLADISANSFHSYIGQISAPLALLHAIQSAELISSRDLPSSSRAISVSTRDLFRNIEARARLCRSANVASKRAIDMLKRRKASALKLEASESCVICLGTYEQHQILVEMPCLHLYHESCIIKWLTKSNSCPICRHELMKNSTHYNAELQQRQSTQFRHSSRGAINFTSADSLSSITMGAHSDVIDLSGSPPRALPVAARHPQVISLIDDDEHDVENLVVDSVDSDNFNNVEDSDVEVLEF